MSILFLVMIILEILLRMRFIVTLIRDNGPIRHVLIKILSRDEYRH
jgi:hypothetical protein